MDPTEPNEEKQPTAELPKDSKGNRYYYRHREAILEKRHQKRMEDPVYQAKQAAKEEKRRQKVEEEKERARKREERRLTCAERWRVPSGANNFQEKFNQDLK